MYAGELFDEVKMKCKHCKKLMREFGSLGNFWCRHCGCIRPINGEYETCDVWLEAAGQLHTIEAQQLVIEKQQAERAVAIAAERERIARSIETLPDRCYVMQEEIGLLRIVVAEIRKGKS